LRLVRRLKDNRFNLSSNAVSAEELAIVKEQMDEDFQANQLKPGDDGFVYDKRVDFEPDEDNDWDEDMEEPEEDDDLFF
jgi:hypothetical protein